MRAYGINRRIKEENMKHFLLKNSSRIQLVRIRDKKLKEIRKREYIENFKRPGFFLDRDNSIPHGKYCIPYSIFAVDIIEKENTDRLRKGMSELYKKCLSHKFFGNNGNNNFEEFLTKMNDDTSSSQSWTNCGIFDFLNNKILNKQISHFEIMIINCSNSYYAIEVIIYLADEKISELERFINSNYYPENGFTSSFYMWTKSGSGSRKKNTVNHPNNNTHKSEVLNSMFLKIKWELFQELSKFVPLLLHNKNTAPPSVNIFKTNISYKENDVKEFWDSIGACSDYSDYFSETEKLFYYRDTNIKLYHGVDDMMYITNDKEVQHIKVYHSVDVQIVNQFMYVFEEFYKFILGRVLLESYELLCSKYRNRINMIDNHAFNYRKLLKLRYKFEKEMDMFVRFFQENDWKYEAKRAEEMFAGIVKYKSNGFIHYNNVIELVPYQFQKIDKIRKNITRTIEHKIEITDHIKQYKYANRNLLLNTSMLLISLLMLLISSVTLFLILNPEYSAVIMKIISDVF